MAFYDLLNIAGRGFDMRQYGWGLIGPAATLTLTRNDGSHADFQVTGASVADELRILCILGATVIDYQCLRVEIHLCGLHV